MSCCPDVSKLLVYLSRECGHEIYVIKRECAILAAATTYLDLNVEMHLDLYLFVDRFAEKIMDNKYPQSDSIFFMVRCYKPAWFSLIVTLMI